MLKENKDGEMSRHAAHIGELQWIHSGRKNWR